MEDEDEDVLGDDGGPTRENVSTDNAAELMHIRQTLRTFADNKHRLKYVAICMHFICVHSISIHLLTAYDVSGKRVYCFSGITSTNLNLFLQFSAHIIPMMRFSKTSTTCLRNLVITK